MAVQPVVGVPAMSSSDLACIMSWCVVTYLLVLMCTWDLVASD
jgi:hypothetical protein